ncbi:type II secretion system protein GspM [Rhizobium sp. PP-CC-3G-465]|uniref:type II secretion system protein GspM n=1 Tax=Rhizobium sp. PP-CC-3G-465 TaxID=2135648 RepID=UPI0010DF185B|nr:type II secretion system (T2SS) protein M subtype b [Rhizobium sp. PP-CC-3G-465]
MGLSSRQQRITAILFPCVLAIIAACMIITQAYSFLFKLENLSDKREALGRLQAIASAGTRFQKQLLPPNEINPAYIQGDNEAVAMAGLQSWIQDVVVTNGGQVNSTSNLVETPEEGVSVVGLTLNFTGNVDAIYATVAAIEGNRPRLVVKELSVHSNQQQLLDGSDAAIELTATVSFVGAYSPPNDGKVSQ